MIRRTLFAAPTLLWVGCYLLLGGCTPTTQEFTRAVIEGKTMGTYYKVVLSVEEGREVGPSLKEGIDAVLEKVNDQMSTYRKESELSRFNRSQSTEWITVSEDLVDVADAAAKISELSHGAFDVTVGPLVNLWGFGPVKKKDFIPSDQEIEEAKKRVGYQQLSTRKVDPALRKSSPGLYVDLSAIAKGFGVDKVGELLESEGFNHYLVDIGGDMKAVGSNPDGQGWRIGIERPDAEGREIEKLIEVKNFGVATSGDYRNYFERDGQRYSHTINSVTGRPITHRLASVTVVAPTATEADGMATAIMALGPEQGLKLAKEQGLGVFLLVREGEGFSESMSPGFEQFQTE
ncbi:MAG: FAD:protein FMN transferase [Arenicellales bacterium]|nr:FAD:protein FMN transferase [Arenicellales bacterium]MDP7156217.1 FAD:protein FMN transferase [Arenicellales bacterium]MDP7482114.1 FAD:protein FMN transferase [Arenicellales bacterium]MEE1539769.1 FAD:protein FMN transferase [Arenicellales bacterium]HJL65293.1 FAD:protein FMN transferase [Arenicellales bacterium]